MNRNRQQKLTDIMMGEAVLSLLLDGSAISAESLITRLHALAADEASESRKRACEWAIDEVRHGQSSVEERNAQQMHDRKNVHYLFTHDEPADDSESN